MPHWLNLPGRLWQRMSTPRGRGYVMMVCSLMLVVVGIGGIVDGMYQAATPDAVRSNSGWNAEIAKSEGQFIARARPSFAVRNADGEQVTASNVYVEGWKWTKAANGGKHIDLIAQQTSDCVSFSATIGKVFLAAKRIVKDGQAADLKITFPPFDYYASRVLIGNNQFRGGGGSVVGWAMQAGEKYGSLPWEDAETLGFGYSGRLADQWGNDRGVPKSKLLPLASQYKIRNFAPIRSYQDLVDALGNGYPCPFGAPITFKTNTRTADGKRWLIKQDSRGHAQCFVGIEDRDGRQKGAYCHGTWGPNAHDWPLNGEPPGGGWVSKEIIERDILPAWDIYAITDQDDFLADTTAEWTTFKADIEESGDAAAAQVIAAAEAPSPEPVFRGARQYAFEIGIGIEVVALVVLVWSLWLTRDPSKSRRRRARRAGTDKW